MKQESEIQTMNVEQNMASLINKSEIDMQIATAHKFPRSIKKFRDEAMQMVTLNENVAASCIYALPRDSKTIEGPSARFAEIIFSSWGNCRSGARVVNDAGEFITAQGVFHDLERNTAITFEVQRRITNKKGDRFGADMIGVTGNAASSIALRNAILKGIPKAFWDDIYQAARKTAMGDIVTLANRRAEAIKAFVSYGINQQQILQKLELVGVEDIGLEHLVVLRGLLTAIREGDTTPEQAFADAGGAPQSKKKTTLPNLRDAMFQNNIKIWIKFLQEGGTVEAIVTKLSSSYIVSEDQQKAIANLKNVNIETGEVTQPASTESNDSWLADFNGESPEVKS